MQWRKWRLIASLWRIELDTKSGSLETSDFGENRQNVVSRMWQMFKLDAKSGPLKLDNQRHPYNSEATLLKKKVQLDT